ncbi:SDR family NAD(P)-dependent oxidoreductase [Wenjunlia tyrosinilytica]|uniref:Ketoacyl reductase n=1 Tax=Wenjunlia tyrosinilytica TaxID=1544741 RepID=A0A918DZR6_9ACTN|nr:SDR family NAD(P)-dependent oxidoreductase [Wenjunlia tyrosinilytica]GGO90904.1 ketoacyl reductase [Wenjunlia tyrosinilytica]
MSDLEGLSAVVTGGSRGLGLLIARELADRGCRVTAAARDPHELDEAAELLRTRAGVEVRTAVCDVRDREAVRKLMADAARDTGSVDVVIGNAGIIQVGPVGAVGADEFRSAMDSIFFGALNTSLEALPHLRRSSTGGRLALIGSIGGLLAVPHLLPYSCAKAAVAALAEGLHEEQARYGITVTAVHPGLMRTGSAPVHALFGGDAEREFAWFSAIAGLPLLSMDAERAAARIVNAVERRRTRIVLTPVARAGAKFHGLAPVLTTRLSTLVARFLPEGGAPSGLVEGQDLAGPARTARSRLRRLAGVLNERAADRFNQRGRAASG